MKEQDKKESAPSPLVFFAAASLGITLGYFAVTEAWTRTGVIPE